jgi:hypothetical protein
MAHIQHKHEEKLAKAKRICDVYALGENDLESICDSESITYPTFRNWCYEILEILELYKVAREKNNIAQKGKIRAYALNSLAKAVKGYDYTETTTEARDVKTGKQDADGNEIYKPKIIKKVSRVITVQPNPTLIMFALNNSNAIEDANFVNSRQMDITSKGEKIEATEQKNLSIEQLIAAIDGINK